MVMLVKKEKKSTSKVHQMLILPLKEQIDGVNYEARTIADARNNLNLALDELKNEKLMSQRYLNCSQQILEGNKHALLCLLEDLQILDEMMKDEKERIKFEEEEKQKKEKEMLIEEEQQKKIESAKKKQLEELIVSDIRVNNKQQKKIQSPKEREKGWNIRNEKEQDRIKEKEQIKERVKIQKEKNQYKNKMSNEEIIQNLENRLGSMRDPLAELGTPPYRRTGQIGPPNSNEYKGGVKQQISHMTNSNNKPLIKPQNSFPGKRVENKETDNSPVHARSHVLWNLN
ncbi:MAG: hypothetical protein EZS28_023666 [Streblomastix strix]|uniref:Uncharacterized protein n=1 Tax=Streblomastix strix TaxID=222440 RepID=A0A5J4VE98_9EUKA|nr:MAG: hypothetical protein EZS28_023666 [Streblomastix strix]